MVEIKDLGKRYKNFSLENIDLSVDEGEFFTILGESGCGKSTLLRAIAGVEDLVSGSVKIDGKDVKTALKDGDIAMVFQDSLLLPHLTVKGNILFGVKMRGIDRGEMEERYLRALKELEIEDLGNKYPDEISGGQRQRVSIGRAIVMKPKLLLMDEPFSALDTNLRMRLQELLKGIQKIHGTTIIFVTHDRNEAFYLSTKIGVMRDGKIVQVGSPKEIYEDPKNSYIAEFLGKGVPK